MGLSQALSIAMSGLRANQAALTLVSSNVSNAETPGYTRKTTTLLETGSAGGTSVKVGSVNRQLDSYVQNQLWTEMSGASYATTLSNALNTLQNVYGNPNSDTSLEGTYNALLTNLQALSTSPDSQSARSLAVSSAQSFASTLNYTTKQIQSLRAAADSDINSAIQSANVALQQINKINGQLQGSVTQDAGMATLEDQRDTYIQQLSQTMGIRVVQGDNNQVSIYTTSGVQLVGPGTGAATLSFNPQGTVNASTLYNSDPSKSQLSTITISYAGGGSTDMIATHAITSGTIGADLQLRDQTLVQAQAQVDQLAASVSSALSDKTVSGTAVSVTTPLAQNGYSVDLSGLQPGNVINLSYTDASNTQHKISIVGVSDPSVLPLPNNTTNDPNDQVIGIDLSASAPSIAAQLSAALTTPNSPLVGAHLSITQTGNTLQVLDDGTGNAAVNSLSATVTVTSLTSGSVQLPLFTDGDVPYTGDISSDGSQMTGYAGRITVNPALLADPSRMIIYNTSPLTASGDTSRSDFITSQLTQATMSFSPATGIGTSSNPFTGTIQNYFQQFTSMQANAATAAQQVSDGQAVVVSNLQGKMSAVSGVSIDEEMTNLLALQNAYSANARVMSTVDAMFTTLMQAM